MSCPISDFTIDCNKSAVRFPFVGIDAPNGKSKFRAKLFHRRDKLFDGGYSKKVMIANRLRCRETRVQYVFRQDPDEDLEIVTEGRLIDIITDGFDAGVRLAE